MRMSDYGEWIHLLGMNSEHGYYNYGASNLNQALDVAHTMFVDPKLDYLTVESTLHGQMKWKIKANRKPTRWACVIWEWDAAGVLGWRNSWCPRDNFPDKLRTIYRRIEQKSGGIND